MSPVPTEARPQRSSPSLNAWVAACRRRDAQCSIVDFNFGVGSQHERCSRLGPATIALITPANEAARTSEMRALLDSHLPVELTRIENRLQAVADFEGVSLEDWLVRHDDIRHRQPWILVASAEGGLAPLVNCAADLAVQVVVCSAARHHGVAWFSSGDASHTALVTSRAPGHPWNPESDFGHELAHAAWGPVPFFSHVIEEQSHADITEQVAPLGDSASQISKFVYVLSEISVWFLRQESVPTPTGIPRLNSWKELIWFAQIGCCIGLQWRSLLEEFRDRRQAIAPDESVAVRLVHGAFTVLRQLTHLHLARIPPDLANLQRAIRKG